MSFNAPGFGAFGGFVADSSAPRQQQVRSPPPKNGFLSHDHFDLLKTTAHPTKKGWSYQEYRVIHPQRTLILYSKESPDMPIAAISFAKIDPEFDSRILVSRRPDVPKAFADKSLEFFQAMFSSGGEFYTTITNLTHFTSYEQLPRDYSDPGVDKSKLGYLKIDLLGDDVPVNEVDLPGASLNQVNELGPSESIVIESDQRRNNAVLMLSESERSVGEDEAQAGANLGKSGATHGAHIFVNVVSSSFFYPMAELLRGETIWMAGTEVFVRLVEVRHDARPQPRTMAQINAVSGPGLRNYGWGGHAYENEGIITPRSSGTQPEFEYNAEEKLWRPTGRMVPTPPRNSVHALPIPNLPVVRGGHAFGGGAPSSGPGGFSFGARPASVHNATQGGGFSNLGGGFGGFGSSETAKGLEVTTEQTSSAKAGVLSAGSRRVKVNSISTNHKYVYKYPAARIVIGLSVWRDVFEYDALSRDECVSLGTMKRNDLFANHARELLALLVKRFKAEECVICLSDTPTHIILQCGHQCICAGCSASMSAKPDKCYVCRARVAGVVKAEQ